MYMQEEREKKRNEQLARKKEAQKMLEEEESTLPVKPQLQPSAKVTRAEIEAHRAAQAAAAAAAGQFSQAKIRSHARKLRPDSPQFAYWV